MSMQSDQGREDEAKPENCGGWERREEESAALQCKAKARQSGLKLTHPTRHTNLGRRKTHFGGRSILAVRVSVSVSVSLSLSVCVCFNCFCSPLHF